MEEYCVVFLGIVEFFSGINVFLLMNNSGVEIELSEQRFSSVRIMGFAGMTINYGLYLCFVASLIIYRLVSLKHMNWNFRYWTAYFLVVSNVLMTLSRTCILLLIVTQTVLLLKYFGVKSILAGYFITVSAFLLMVLFTISGLGEGINNIAYNLFYMILAIFNDKFQMKISNGFGGNLGGVGNRFDLYEWVWSELKGEYIFGATKTFFHKSLMDNGYWLEKTSIEVHYLAVLYSYGAVGLAAEIVLFVNMLKNFVKRRRNNFFFIVGFTSLVFYASLFLTSMQEEKRIFIILYICAINYKKCLEENEFNG